MKTTANLTTATEEFKTIDGYNDAYHISNYGRVVSTKYGKSRTLRPSVCGQGYSQVCLCINGKMRVHKIHRLVAIKFLVDTDESRICVNHKDANRKNNHIDNLELCTQGENVRDAISKGQKDKMSQHCNPHIKRAVIIYDPFDDISYTIESMYRAAKQLDVKIAAIYNCCTGRQKTVKGLIISYAN